MTNKSIAVVAALFFSVATPALAQAPIIQNFGDWKISCKIDRMTDIPYCMTTIRLNQCNASVLLNNRGGVTIVSAPRPMHANIRVDRKTALRCDGYPYCEFIDADSINLQAQIQDGTTLVGEIVGVNSYCEFSQPISGRYQQMLDIAREWGQHLPEPKTAKSR